MLNVMCPTAISTQLARKHFMSFALVPLKSRHDSIKQKKNIVKYNTN